jgi:thiamine biosynthesis lipoprotein
MAALATAGDDSTLKRFEGVETHMGSPFKIILYTSDDATASRAMKAAFTKIAELDQALSDYNPESELMKLCDKSGGPPVVIGPDLFFMLERSKAMAERSGGAFDPTVAPVIRLWRRARREHKLPDPQTLQKAMSLVGFQKIHLDRDKQTAQLDKGVKLDLGGIAKGYASHEAVKVLKKHGISRSLVAGAGDIAVGDAPPDKAGWSVAIAPLDGLSSGKAEHWLILKNQCVSTAGDGERYVEIEGKRYSHIVDPRTGQAQTERTSVTVISPDGALSDALDTSASVLGIETGLKLIKATPGAEAYFIRRTTNGEVRAETEGFKLFVK